MLGSVVRWFYFSHPAFWQVKPRQPSLLFSFPYGMAVVGDPAEVRARIAGYADSGVTHLLCAFGAGAVEPAVTRESLELFAREVMPAFPAAAGGQPSTVGAAPAGRGAPHTAGRLADS